MSEFKIGDKVCIEDRLAKDRGGIGTVKTITGQHGEYWELDGNTQDGGGFTDRELRWPDEAPVGPKPEVKVVKTIQVKKDGLIVQHAVGSRKRRIVISKNITIDDLDTLVSMLNKLKEEVLRNND
jgi:hypothetical protein